MSVFTASPHPAPPPDPAVATDEAVADGAIDVAILEDEPALGKLAAELSRGLGASAAVYGQPAQLLEASRESAPRVLVLDWRLEGQLGAAAFMAIRHRYPAMPIVCWTASAAWNLPEMICNDPMTRVIDKAAGAAPFEAALRWALG